MRVDLGMDVFSTNGDKVGTVERLVLDANTKELDKLIVSSGGLLSKHEKLVDVNMVVGENADGLQIDLTEDQFNELPDYVQDRFRVANERETVGLPYAIAPGTGGGAILFGATTGGRGYDGGSFYEPAPAAQPIIETRSNVSEQDVMIGEGTEVVGADGEKVGKVGEVFFGEDGQIMGFTVKGGLFKDDVRIPIDLVSATGSDQITLTVTSAEAEAQSFDIEDSSL